MNIQPRYKVIADYPENNFGVGDIVELDFEHNPEEGSFWYHDCGLTQGDFEKYPHLFKRLEWWEDLTTENFPKYVKFTEDFFDYKKGIYKVDKFEYSPFHKEIRPTVWMDNVGLLIDFGKPPIIPATELEYKQSL